MIFFIPAVSVIVSSALIAFILSSRFGGKIQDIPNERSLHSTPVPRSGGVGLISGVLAGWAFMAVDLAWWLVVPLLALFVVSLLDDMRGLPVRVRLPAHMLAAALMVVGAGLFGTAGGVVALAVLLLTVWMTNLYNFMDGSNGLAGGMALFGFGSYGVAAMLAHDHSLAALNFAVAAAALGFLIFNFHPARIFMGDAGSIPLGFLAAALGVLGWQRGAWEAWFPLLAFSPFIVDATVTLARRTLRGAKITEAHREHYYQRAIQLGWSHRRLALVEYALMLASGGSALWSTRAGLQWPVLVGWVLVYGVLMVALDAAWKRRGAARHA